MLMLEQSRRLLSNVNLNVKKRNRDSYVYRKRELLNSYDLQTNKNCWRSEKHYIELKRLRVCKEKEMSNWKRFILKNWLLLNKLKRDVKN